MQIRGQIRQAVRNAISANVEFASWTALKARGQKVSEDNLPAFLVFTPRETNRSIDGVDVERETHVVIQARLRGNDDIEDVLDDASAALTPVVFEALRPFGDTELNTTDTDVPGEGSARFGIVEMAFRVTRYVPEDQSE